MMESQDKNKFVPITEKRTDCRDGEVVDDIDQLDRVGNLIRYMRQHPAYTPPNPWPQSMMCHGFKDGFLIRTIVLPIDDFESKTDEAILDLVQADKVVLMPAQDSPSPNLIKSFFEQDRATVQHTLDYLVANNWLIRRK